MRQQSTTNQRYTQFADGFALEPSGLLPTGPLESLGHTGSPRRGLAKLLFLDHFRATSMIPKASPWRNVRSSLRRFWSRLDLDWSPWWVAVPQYVRTGSGWTGYSLANGFLVVEGVVWAFAACCWMLTLDGTAGVGRSAGIVDVPIAATATATESLTAML